ncbi:unnamed protein product [Cladocopium goreaui]|uniref:Uncharacterized protein n=1 Tax=Cladocopium goreaui TaxID=2562237 RepID=A0A9P1G8H0_9DINO|nr:unnamed protein product [Cladocopium goreaui]
MAASMKTEEKGAPKAKAKPKAKSQAKQKDERTKTLQKDIKALRDKGQKARELAIDLTACKIPHQEALQCGELFQLLLFHTFPNMECLKSSI